MLRRFTMIAAVALVAFAAVIPAVGACCVKRPSRAMMSMRASMPCCEETCKLTRNTERPDRDYALTAPTSTFSGLIAVAVVEAPVTVTRDSESIEAVPFASPPTFLAHHQFRI